MEREGQLLARLRPGKLAHVLLFGDIPLSPGAVALLLQHAVPVSFLDGRGKLKGRLVPDDPGPPPFRFAQYAVAQDRDKSLSFARAVVARKLSGERQLLRRHVRNHLAGGLGEVLETLSLSIRQAGRAPSLPRLRGIEGRGTAAYFSAFRDLLRHEADFSRRLRRPPPDPINAMLSFGYYLLTAEITAQVSAVGLDPQVGFLHITRPGRPALALDLIEEFRAPVVDRVVLRCWNLRIITPDDFEEDHDRGPRFTREARRRFLREYESRMNAPFRHVRGFHTTFRRLLHGQARAVAGCFRRDEPYEGLPIRL